MENKTLEIFRIGLNILNPIMRANNFHYRDEELGKGSGGDFAKGKYVKGDRILEMHFRYSLGLVTYQIGKDKLSHEDYMYYVAGKNKSNYPGFSDNPLDGFKHLVSDLENYAKDFLSGSGKVFKMALDEAEKRNKLPGYQQLYH